jgi:molybdate transport system ATP-binding protein
MPPMSRSDACDLEVCLARASVRREGRPVLRAISWTLRPGERWLLAGGNGAGKTQLLKLVAGIVWPAPSADAVLTYRLRGELSHTPQGVREAIAYLGPERQDKYERYGWDLPVSRIVGTGIYHSDIALDEPSAADRARIERALAALRITHLARRHFLSLSYGERRVVLLARVLVARPKLLLLDEVLNGLDVENRARVQDWLAHAGKLPWVFATHRAEDVPPNATHALLLDAGRVRYRGPLTGAPLSGYLAHEVRRPVTRGHLRYRPRGTLVRLCNARVYLRERPVLSGISLAIRRGEWWLVHGDNGSGKTTLLRTLYGDHGVAAGGCIERAGIAPGVPLERFKVRVGLIAPHLQAEHPRQLTVREAVASGRYASIGLNAGASLADQRAARRALALFGLTGHAGRMLAQLSYGQLRRVLFARAWVRRPQLLLLDEAFAGLDAPTRRTLLARVVRLAASGVAVVSTGHERAELKGCASHELELGRGRPLYCGPLRANRQRAKALQ